MDKKGRGLVAKALLTLGAPIGLFPGSHITVVGGGGQITTQVTLSTSPETLTSPLVVIRRH